MTSMTLVPWRTLNSGLGPYVTAVIPALIHGGRQAWFLANRSQYSALRGRAGCSGRKTIQPSGTHAYLAVHSPTAPSTTENFRPKDRSALPCLRHRMTPIG